MMRVIAALLVVAAAALMQGCATPRPTERVVLLPGEDGRKGAVLVTRRDGGSIYLDRPYAIAQVSSAAVTLAPHSSADAVASRYATLLSVQPPRVRSYTLHFEANQSQLAAESWREVERILSEAAMVPAAEIDVIGHTDTMGAADYNDALGQNRAQFVASLMAMRGFGRARISVQSRGERELLIQTPDDTAEPRNRRVEIRLR